MTIDDSFSDSGNESPLSPPPPFLFPNPNGRRFNFRVPPPPINEAPVTAQRVDTGVVSERVDQNYGHFIWPISLENNQLILGLWFWVFLAKIFFEKFVAILRNFGILTFSFTIESTS